MMIDWHARGLKLPIFQQRRQVSLVAHVEAVLKERLSFLTHKPSIIKEIWDSSVLEGQDPKTVDAMVHILNLHWSDDLLSSFKKIKKTLKPKGLVLAALLGERTLQELKAVFTHVEASQRGYVTPRFLPLPTAGQVTSLVQEAGFSNPVLDREIMTQEYDALSQCYEDLRGMGETNQLQGRFQGLTTPHFMGSCANLYRKRFSTKKGKIFVTFEVLYLMAWH